MARFPLDKKLYAFDLDDTLIGTKVSYLSAIAKGLRSVSHLIPDYNEENDTHSFRVICREFGSSNIAEYTRAFFKMRLGQTPETEKISKLYLESYEREYWNGLSCYEGCKEMLELLLERGKKICLVSNADKVGLQKDKIRKTGLADYFDPNLIFISGEHPSNHRKPFPDMLELACRKTGIPPGQSLYGGNILADMIAANLAGFFSLLYDHQENAKPEIPFPVKVDLRLRSWKNLFGR